MTVVAILPGRLADFMADEPQPDVSAVKTMVATGSADIDAADPDDCLLPDFAGERVKETFGGFAG